MSKLGGFFAKAGTAIKGAGAKVIATFGEKIGQSGYGLDQLIADFGPIATDPEAVKDKIIELSEGAIDESSVGPLCEFSFLAFFPPPF